MRSRLRSGKSLVLLLVGCAVVSIGLGLGIGLFLGKGAMASSGKKKEADHGKEHPKEPHAEAVLSLGEMIINLADPGSLRYAKISVAVGFAKKLDEEHMKEHTPLLRDTVINVVTAKRFGELHAPGGVKKAKQQLKEAMQKRLHDVPIAEVYFEGFAIQ